MDRYWKNQYPQRGAVTAGAAESGGVGTPRVSGPPVVSAVSDQDKQAAPEQKRRSPGFAGADGKHLRPRVTPLEFTPLTSLGGSDLETASQGGAFVGEPQPCEDPSCVRDENCPLCGGLYERRKCKHCGTTFDVYNDDPRVFCDRACDRSYFGLDGRER